MHDADLPIDQLTRLGTVRAIIRWGSPILHRPARPATDFGDALQMLLADMFATNTAAKGAGLAAPQIGVSAASLAGVWPPSTGRRGAASCQPVQ
jgi:peptide deformylase